MILEKGSEAKRMKSLPVMCWPQKMIDPSGIRQSKPRTTGCTMILDKGLGLSAFRDLVSTAGDYIDWIKLGFGTPALTPIPILREKLAIAQSREVILYPGGTMFEVAHAQDQVERYFSALVELGFTYMEISDGTVDLSRKERDHYIRAALSNGLNVITEIGKKADGSYTPIPLLTETYHRDRESGAAFVIVEGRESGKNVGIYNEKGEADMEYLFTVHEQIGSRFLIWEAPQKSQQVQLLQALGPDIHLGNVSPQESLAVEALRRGLRSDTFAIGLRMERHE
jgi:phosphosulfolactate synthase